VINTRSRRSIFLAIVSLPLLATAPALADQCQIKIGTAGPLTGGSAAWGLAVKAGAEFVAALANEAGGVQMGDQKCTVKVVSFDSQYTAAGGAAASNYFASEDVHVVIGPVGAPEVTGFKPVAKRNSQLSFNTTYAKDAIGPDYPLVFHQLQAPPTWGPILIKRALDRFKLKSVVLIGPNDQGGTDATRALAKMYADAGATAQEEYYQRGTTNFAAIATRIMNANPDGIEVSTVPPGDQAVLLKQLIEAGYGGVFGSLGGGGEKPILDGSNQGADLKSLKGAYWLSVVAIENPNMPQLRSDFERVMKASVPINGNFYTTVISTEQVFRAMSAAGTDKDAEKVADALRKLTPESRYFGKGGWRGKAMYGINQELAFPVGFGVYESGTRVGVESVAIPSEAP